MREVDLAVVQENSSTLGDVNREAGFDPTVSKNKSKDRG